MKHFTHDSQALTNATIPLILIFAFLLMFIGMPKPKPAGGGGGDSEPHDQPPIIHLTEAAGFTFQTGKADLSDDFQKALHQSIVPALSSGGKKFRTDVIECVGHTDSQLLTGNSNVDKFVGGGAGKSGGMRVVAGSNVDLGFLRCWSVIGFLKNEQQLEGFKFISLSAGPTVLPSGELASAEEGAKDDATRRRIELRLRRAEKVS